VFVFRGYLSRVNVNEYLGRIMIYPHNTRQIKTRQCAFALASSNSCVEIMKYSAMEIRSKIPSEIKNKTCLALFATEYKFIITDWSIASYQEIF